MKFLLFALPILAQPFNPSPRTGTATGTPPRDHGGFLPKRKNRTCKLKYLDNSGKWSSWADVGGELDSVPASCSRKRDNYHIFCKGTDGQI
ncbi:uncharacterized protein CTHT_0040170 [Thermochaetoides thermophila DSM 1495]|uniref:Uncharacterized protein n=1 Tax=Chaetomium thermophilum (strain DSM 1495 / CBS 144.50 / IMI 039719) TaxID=759272 RepID=G0S8S5_CHATD|nr:hypothetical protein CTHT_0040170 [Thermochaetoides thermophila DSM 1495]EGS20278.1 hypothetical protein CTHT_0040170 [Thermochaetoides thermophila DSM 1495]